MVLQNNDASKQRRVTYKFVTDNPYRLLSQPSSISPRVLRQKALAAEQASQVGLPVEVSLANTFGCDELPQCSDIVRALSADAVTCMLHRQMWPYLLLPQPETATFPFDTLPSETAVLPDFHMRQWTFLGHWFNFILNDHTPSLVQALNYFTYLYEDSEHQDYLEQMLRKEGDSDKDSKNTVIDAQDRLFVFLIREACAHALEMLKNQNLIQFRAIFSEIQNRSLQDEKIEHIVTDTFVTFGDRERERVDQDYQRTVIALSQTGWSPLWAAFDLSGVMTLRELAFAVGQCYSSAYLWYESANRYADLIGCAMRQYSITIANESEDYKTAVSVLHQVLELPISLLLSEKVSSDLKDIAALIDARRKAEANTTSMAHEGGTKSSRQAVSVDDFIKALDSKKGPQSSQQPSNAVGQKAGENNAVRGEHVASAPNFVEFLEFDTKSVIPPTKSVMSPIKPVTSPPLLFTLNGFGLRLYGRGRYVDNPLWHYTTLFVTLLFVPIIPLAR